MYRLVRCGVGFRQVVVLEVLLDSSCYVDFREFGWFASLARIGCVVELLTFRTEGLGRLFDRLCYLAGFVDFE